MGVGALSLRAGRSAAASLPLVSVVVSVLLLSACGAGGLADPLGDLPDIEVGPPPVVPLTRESPTIAMSTSGKATCTWVGDDRIFAERFIPGHGWTDWDPVSDGAAPASPPRVAMDEDGDAVIVFEQEGEIIANCFEVGSGWQGPEPISGPFAPPAANPQVGSADDGTTVAVWEETGDVVGSVFNPATGWEPPTVIADPPAIAGGVQLTVNPSGDAVAVWDEGGSAVVAATFDVLTGTWSAPVVLGSGNAPAVAGDDAGGAVAVFQDDGEIAAAVFDPDDGWQAATTVPVPAGVQGLPADEPDIDLDGSGAGAVVFDVAGETFASGYDPAGGFGTAESVAPAATSLGRPDVAVDDGGNAVVVFEDVLGHVQGVIYHGEHGQWTDPLDVGPGHEPSIDVNDDGQAMAVFHDRGHINAWYRSDLEPSGLHLIEAKVQGQGSIASDPAGLECDHTTVTPCWMVVPAFSIVRLVATPAPGYRFSRWEGVPAGVATQPTIDLVVERDAFAVAVFEPDP